MGKALKTAGAIIGGAVLMATGVGALAGMQVTAMGIAGVGTMSVANLQLMSAGLMAAGSMLDKPKSTASGSPSDWTSNPDQGTPFLFGRMGVAGKIVHRDEYGPDNRLQGIVTVYSGAGPVKSFQGFSADELPVSFESNGGTAIGKYRRQMWRSWRMGNQPDTALSLPTGLDGGAVMPMWGAAYRLSGKACDLLTMQMDSKFSVYPSGEPKPMQVLEGVFGYDPRYDDTYPGGAGPCRYGVRSTYRYIDNAIIAALNWALGMIENGQVVGGIGASLQGVDLPALIEAANIADANAWTVAAWPDTSEDASVVLDELLEAGGAKRARVAGKISCVSRGAPRPSIVTITRRDTAGAIELDTGASRFNRLNTITPVIMSEAHKWKHAPMDPVSFAALVTEDGGKRSDQIKYRFVSKVKQGAELAAYDILDAREPFSGTIPLLPHLRRLKPGDCFDIDEPGFMLDGVKMLVLSRSYDARAGEVRIAFRSETDSKHPLALGKTTTMPEYPGLTVPDPTEVTGPLPGDWTIVPRPPGGGGVQVPIIDIIGEVSNGTATAVHFEWWVVPSGVDPSTPPPADAQWQSAGIWPPTVTSIPVQAEPGAIIWVAASYLRGENFSDRKLYGPVEVPGLIAGGVTDDAAQKLLDDALKGVDDKVKEAAEEIEKAINLDDVFNGQGDLAEAILKLGRGQSELQRIIETHTREGGVLVKSIVKVMGGDLENAQGAIVEEARLSLERDRAEALLREALALQVDQNEIVFQSSISGLVTDLAAEVRARQDLGARVANAEGAIVNEATIRANQDGVWLQNFNLLGARRGNGSGWVLNKATVDITDEGTLAQVLSGLRAVDGANSSSITALSQASANQASQLLTLTNTVGGQTASISQLFQVMEGIGARWTVALDSNGTSTGLVADGQTRSWVFSGASLSIIDAGNGLSYVPATGRLKIVKGNKKTVLGAGNDLIVWAGNTSVADGAETVDNGDFGIGSGDAWFGGRTLSRPFDSGAGPDTPIVIPADTWTVIAETTLHRMREGVFMTAVSLEALVASSTSEGAISWVVESVNASGGDPVIVAQSGFNMTANIIPWTTGWSQYIPGLGRRSGLRRLRLSVAWRNPPTTGVTIRRARLWGLYTADVTSWP